VATELPNLSYTLDQNFEFERIVTEEDRRLLAELEESNAELRTSLKKCRKLVADCRRQLVANGTEPVIARAETDKRRRGV
jgi:hypothetical protein